MPLSRPPSGGMPNYGMAGVAAADLGLLGTGQQFDEELRKRRKKREQSLSAEQLFPAPYSAGAFFS
ncbi:hypothetical protein L0337_11475 [candidate division KSB1 bacterium]|nr:hypothetical protein [candidate division KSB1 bacterium]